MSQRKKRRTTRSDRDRESSGKRWISWRSAATGAVIGLALGLFKKGGIETQIVVISTLFGIVFLSHQLGGFLGAWLGGYVYDATGSYDAVWWFSVALGVMSALCHLPIEQKPVARLSNA